MVRRKAGRRKKARSSIGKRVKIHGQSMVCKPVGGKRALKKCIVSTMQRMKFTTAKGARKAFASATKKCRKQIGATRTVRRRRRTRKARSSYVGRSRIAPYYRREMGKIRPDLW